MPGSPYRTAGERESLLEKDPFPTIACYWCGAPTVSMNGEACCARCDFYHLTRGRDLLLAFSCASVRFGIF